MNTNCPSSHYLPTRDFVDTEGESFETRLSVPLVFREGGGQDTPYIADLYEHVSFLGDLNKQIAELPDGAQVRLVIAPKPGQ